MSAEGKSKKPHKIDILMVGDAKVGKTALLSSFTGKPYLPAYDPTIGMCFEPYCGAVDKESLNFRLWDSSGQECFQNVVAPYYKGAHGVVVVCDLTNENSFTSINGYINKVRAKCPQGTPIVLVGTKFDVAATQYGETPRRQVTTEELQQAAKAYGCIAAIEVDSKSGINVNAPFVSLAKKILSRKQEAQKQKNAEERMAIKTSSDTKRNDYLTSSRGQSRAHDYAENFNKIWNKTSGNEIAKIKALLEDYVNPSSCFGMFMRFSRHHAKDINPIITKNYNSADELKADLNKIVFENVEGMLSHMLDFIENGDKKPIVKPNILEAAARRCL